MRNGVIFLLLAILLGTGLFSCRKDNLITDSSAKLEFSLDTVIFDTVFTTVGSTTQWLKVFNPHNQPIKISEVYVAGGNSSNFRINVDGTPGDQKDVEIAANDSMFVFVEVTVDPNGGTTPLIISDSLVFVTNSNVQDVDLVAWGQDAYFYNTTLFSGGGALQLPNDKPNVFYGLGIIDSATTLVIPEGTMVHFHKGAGLIAGGAASLQVNGTPDNPVIFQGDRLEESWSDVPGQWGPILGGVPRGGIWLTATSRNNHIDYAIIKNGDIGIQVDSIGSLTAPTLRMKGTQVLNMSGVGLLAQGSWVEAENCLFANAGNFVAAFNFGGEKYDFKHCTFANYWRFGARNNGMMLLNNYFETIDDEIITRDLKETNFTNCIVYGNVENEIELDKNTGAQFNFFFDNCLLRTDNDVSDASNWLNNIYNPDQVIVDNSFHDPVFNDFSEIDFTLFDLSAAVDQAKNISIQEDLTGALRDANPDIGCYEWIP